MKTKVSVSKWLPLVAAALLGCASNLPAQTPPAITTQPTSQTNLAGTTATFTVAVTGTGPFTYQWQLNGTNLPNNIITTVAGGGSNWDGDAALGAELYYPGGVAFDKAGNMYFADANNNRVRKVNTNGILSTVAGNGTNGYSGDGGAATNASLGGPSAVAVDSIGDLYFTDQGNNRIRKVGTNGIIITVAGTNAYGFSGDGGAAVNAELYSPSGVAVDGSGNLYIADTVNNRIRKVGTNGIIKTVAGTNASGFSGDGSAAINAKLNWPEGVAVDGLVNLYIADTDNYRVRVVDTNGIINTFAALATPVGVAFDPFGNVYIASQSGNCIREVTTNGVITTVAGNGSGSFAGDGGPATNASLNAPLGVALDSSGNLYIADEKNSRIRKVFLYAGYPTLTLTNVGAANAGSYTLVISNSSGSVTSAVATLTVSCPPAILIQPASQFLLTGGNATLNVSASGTAPLYYSWYDNTTNLVQSGLNSALTVQDFATNDTGSYTVVITNAYGSVSSQVATLTTAQPPLIATPPGSQAVLGGANLTLSVTAGGTGPLNYQWQFNGTNLPTNIITTVAGGNGPGLSGDGGPAINARLFQPAGISLDALGNLYIADYYNNRVRKVDTNGIITTVAGSGTSLLAYGPLLGDGSAATNAHLYRPSGVAFDFSGNLYIADSLNDRIRKVDTNGLITTVAGDVDGATYYDVSFSGDGGPSCEAGLCTPEGAVADALGDLFIMDTGSTRVRKVDSHGIITTVAGGGHGGLGDGGPAIYATLAQATNILNDALCLDPLGNLYIADCDNQRIRKVDTNGIITTVAGNGSSPTPASGPSPGDGGPATNASLGYPCSIAFDANGNLYIANSGTGVVRKVDTNGIITTAAGGGKAGDGGPATSASLGGPDGLAFDATGNLYIADYMKSNIREVHFAGFPTLAITNASATNAGNYSVVVTSPCGSVTSAVATVTVQAPPVITLQPTNQTVLAGSSPTFSVTAAGSGTFEYLWYFAGTNLVQSGRSSSLTLPNVFTNNAGSYTAVVINTWGSVTSAVASLTVTIPTNAPQIVTGDGCCGFLDNQFGFNLSGAYGQTIVVDGSTDLVNWTPLFTNICVGDGGSAFYFWDPCCTNFGCRYYRARLP